MWAGLSTLLRVAKLGVVFCTLLCSVVAIAKVSEQEARRLDGELTPLGAQREGSPDGLIPAWTGGITAPPEGYQQGDFLQDPFIDEAPLAVITADNVAAYQHWLSDGQQALLKQYPDTFHMRLYPSHRTHAAPEWLYRNTRRNATLTTLTEDGSGILNAFGGVPFPIPQSGLEVIWNHVTRWRGIWLRRDEAEAVVYPNASRKMYTADLDIMFNYYAPRANPNDTDNILLFYKSLVKSPARLAGGAFLLIDPIDQTIQPRQTWGYNAGQRRVRRLPHASHDSAALLSESTRTMDDTDMFNGSPERFTWTIVGKRQLIVPYNCNRLGLPDLSYDELLWPHHINPHHVRYEVHRVWVLEARLKPNARHIYSRRVFYVDEDSWGIMISESYDHEDQLWRVGMSHGWAIAQARGVMPVVDVYHDLKTGRYNAKGMQNHAKGPGIISEEVRSAEHYTPAALRKLGRR
ncbi:MAG: DUF1329 domain-containing protein [Oleiphilaceae bacterium]|nr:DUF1329 domain-containing protein [Oleiphilaceae bacterium]